MTDLRETVLEGLADGKSLREICRADDMPSVTSILRMVSTDTQFAEQYARARAAGDDAMAEDIQAIADGPGDPQDKRVKIDARKWLLAKRQPKKYGDKLAVGGADDLPPMRTIDVSGISSDALRELARLNAPNE